MLTFFRQILRNGSINRFCEALVSHIILYKVLIDKGVALEYRHGIKLKFKRQKKTVIPMGTN